MTSLRPAAPNGVHANGSDPEAIILETIAHDLRGDLTSIIAFGEFILSRRTSLTGEEITDYASVIVDKAKHMSRVLYEIVDLHRFAAGEWVLYRRLTSVRESIDRIVLGLDVPGRSLNVIGEGPPVEIDPGLLERIVENLVGNATVHTPAGTPIVIVVAGDDDAAEITVDDLGLGVPDEMKRTVFEPFRSGRAGGSGLGLALVAWFADVHGGRAWVEDRPGGGARFRVRLPAVPNGSPAVRPS